MESHQAWTRRILALGMGFAGMGVLCWLAADGNDTALGAVSATVGTVVAFYFLGDTK